ncbi:MAG: exodeoxyribonuclease VII small subunit [Bacilli bacterium]|jgi:exonuclease VII small subunit
MEKKKDLSKCSYEELEKEASLAVTKLSESGLALDEATKLFEYGKSVLAEMEKRLADLEKKAADTIR